MPGMGGESLCDTFSTYSAPAHHDDIVSARQAQRHGLLGLGIRYQKLPTVHDKHAALRPCLPERPAHLAEHLTFGRDEIDRALRIALGGERGGRCRSVSALGDEAGE